MPDGCKPCARGALFSRDCHDKGPSQPKHLCKAHDVVNGELCTIAAGGKPVPSCPRSRLHTPSSACGWTWVLVLLFLLSCCSATVIALDPTDPQVVHLLDLCRADEPCALRWYLTQPPTPTTPWEAASFVFLLSRFATDVLLAPDGSLSTLPKWQDDPYLSAQAALDPLLLTALDAKQDQHYVALLRSARFCGGLPNRLFRLGEGCICAPQSDCSDAVASTNAFETVTISIGLVFTALVIVFGVWVVVDQLGRTQRTSNATEELLRQVKEAATGHAVVGQVRLRLPGQ